MEKISKTKSSCTTASDYHINEDAFVTKMKTNNRCSQIDSFIVNEDGSVTKKIMRKNMTQNTSKSHTVYTVKSKGSNDSSPIISVGTVLYIIVTIIFFILLFINTYEEGETIGDWITILIGLSIIFGFLYAFIIKPFLNWLQKIL